MSWVISELSKTSFSSQVQDNEAALMKLSSDINFYDMQTSNEIARVSRQHEDENKLIEEQFEKDTEGMDSTSAEYLQASLERNSKLQELDGKQTAEIQKIYDDSDRKINPLEMQKEQLEALIKDQRAQLETWKENALNEAEQECSYFNDK